MNLLTRHLWTQKQAKEGAKQKMVEVNAQVSSIRQSLRHLSRCIGISFPPVPLSPSSSSSQGGFDTQFSSHLSHFPSLMLDATQFQGQVVQTVEGERAQQESSSYGCLIVGENLEEEAALATVNKE